MNSAGGLGERGFTLLELMISISILAFISLGIYQATTETYRLRDILMQEGDFNNGIRFAMDIVQRDVSLMYSPIIFLPKENKKKTGPQTGATGGNPEFPQGAQPEGTGAPEDADSQRATKYFMPMIDPSGVRPIRFQGTGEKMSFVSASHTRLYKNSKESEFAKIEYSLARDERKGAIENTMALMKTESPNAFIEDDEKDTYKRNYKLLYGIKSLKFQYCKIDNGEPKCFSNWDSDNTDFKNQVPDIIEITLEVLGPARLNFSGTFKLRPEVPNRGLSPTL